MDTKFSQNIQVHKGECSSLGKLIVKKRTLLTMTEQIITEIQRSHGVKNPIKSKNFEEKNFEIKCRMEYLF